MKWNDQNRRVFLRNSSRRSSIAARVNEQAVVEKASRSLLNYGVKRKPRNLENALKVLSAPFNGNQKRSTPVSSNRRTQEISNGTRDRSASVFSNITLPSEFDSTNDLELTSAEEIVLNARRKQAILISIICKFQNECRLHLKRKGSRQRIQRIQATSQENIDNQKTFAAATIQRWYISCLTRIQYSRTKQIITLLQAHRRGTRVRFAYLMLLSMVTRLQAISRGYLTRHTLTSLANDRMNMYKLQIFVLWNTSYTPLSYRSTLWPELKVASFLRLAIAEQELIRLWKELKIPLPSRTTAIERRKDKCPGIHLGSVFGISYYIYQCAIQVRLNSFCMRYHLFT
jgi:hypothetical protein